LAKYAAGRLGLPVIRFEYDVEDCDEIIREAKKKAEAIF
jgi:hypothetical protein